MHGRSRKVTKTRTTTRLVDARVDVSSLRSVAATYLHHQRLVTPGEGITLGSARLKWYDIRRPQTEVPTGLVKASRDFLRNEVEIGRLAIDNELGFVILHRADGPKSPDTVALLLVTTWRSANELWKTFYFKEVDGGASYQELVSGSSSPAFCVWELGAVWHEQQAWSRFLASARDDDAIYAYLEDQFEGLV
jgi:hypothetical protein